MIGWLYDLVSRSSERKGVAEIRRRLAGPLEGEVVEVGAGTGLNLPHYERASHVVAVEPDASMAARLHKRLAEARVPVEVVTADGESLPFEDGRFDAAVATFVFCSVHDPARALAELRRVLRPDGKLVVLEHVRGEGRLARWQDRLTPLHRRISGNCHLNRETLATIEAAGFETNGVERLDLPGTPAIFRPGLQGVAINTSS